MPVPATLAAMGVSETDWTRIKAHVLTATQQMTPAALDDLDAPWRITGCLSGHDRFSGTPIGTYQGRVILAWRKEGDAEPG